MGRELASGGGNQQESHILCVKGSDFLLVHGQIWIQANITALPSEITMCGIYRENTLLFEKVCERALKHTNYAQKKKEPV